MANVLLAVDLQQEFKDNDGQYDRILEMVKNQSKYDAVIATVCQNNSDSPFVKYENWYDCFHPKPLEFKPDVILYKSGYGLPDYSLLDKNVHYDIIGFNTDACVLKIAMDMFDKGFDITVKTAYCYSSSGRRRHENGVELMKHLMSKAVE